MPGRGMQVLIRRVPEHIRDQNWIAVCLDILVVIVGLFLAFQLDRWYDDRRLASMEGVFLVALAEDFRNIAAEFDRKLEWYGRGFEAATSILLIDGQTEEEISHEQFYGWLDEIAYPTIYLESRTYDSLIATGEIDVIGDKQLLDLMAQFYTRAKRNISERDLRSSVVIFERIRPFIIANLDNVAFVQSAHPDIGSAVSHVRDNDQFREIVNRPDFENLIAEYWHQSFDWMNEMRFLRAQVVEVLEILDTNLAAED